MDKWDPAIGDKFNIEIEVSNRHDWYAINDQYTLNNRFLKQNDNTAKTKIEHITQEENDQEMTKENGVLYSTCNKC